MENKFFVNLEAKQIHVPNSRWYEIGNYDKTKLAYPSATTVLSVKNKQGLSNWQIQIAKSGLDPKEISMRMMDEGSCVHNAAELLMNGNSIVYDENYDFYGEWLPICRFVDAYSELQIKPILIEQMIWSNRMKSAGTLDLFCTLMPKGLKNPVFALIDLKRSASAYIDYQWQISAYKEMLTEMIKKPDSYSKRLIEFLTESTKINKEDLIKYIENIKCYLLLLNTPTKKGWRLTEVTETEEKLKGFEACNSLFRIENPNLEYIREIYPTELKLKT